MPHPMFTLLAAVLLSMALAMVENRSLRERLCVATRLLFCCAMTVLAGAWLMRLLHG